MRFDAPTISDHRLQRFHRWAMLWLTWFAAFLDAASAFAPLSRQAERIAHGWLDWIETLITNIVLIRAAKRVRPLTLKRWAAPRGGERDPKRRAILGYALSRSLRDKDLCARIAALSQDIDALIDRVIRRLPRGLTRLRGFRAATHPHALTTATSHARSLLLGCRRAGADTS